VPEGCEFCGFARRAYNHNNRDIVVWRQSFKLRRYCVENNAMACGCEVLVRRWSWGCRWSSET
jgi:hypothetical protein